MDKYTVDLDKVLNDFEYSELTDQYNVSRQTNENHLFATSSHSLDNPRSKIKDTNIKHSMNNVFHSLNEYLNSDINVKSYEPNLNGNTSNGLKVDKEPLNNTLNYLPVVEVVKLSDIENTSIKTSDIAEVKVENNLKTAPVEETISLVDISIDDTGYQTNINSNKDTNISYCNKDTEINVSPNDLYVHTDENIHNELVTDKEYNNDGIEESRIKLDIVEDVLEDPPETLQTKLDSNEATLITNETEISIVQQEKIPIEENMQDEDVIEPNKDNVTQENDVCDDKSEVSTSVGFHKNYELDEQEVYKYLEELENECEDEDIEVGRIEESIKDEESVPVKENVIVHIREEVEEEKISDDNSVIENCTEIKSEEDKTDENIKNNTVQNSNSTLEVSALNEPETDNSVNEISEMKCNPISETSVSTESENNSTLSRPNTLELNTNSEVTTVNLIGAPGSTPYNNVYISNTLDLDNQQNDTGTASSLSPTVSEISTDSPNTSESLDMMPPVANSQNGNELAQGDNNLVTNAKSNNDTEDFNNEDTQEHEGVWKLGKTAPFWIPDSETTCCQHCDIKFTVIKRRHHCRACGLVLCSKCCNMKFKLEYLEAEARVCVKCYEVLSGRDTNSSSGSDMSPVPGGSPHSQPNPNNPMEYCSVIPPLQQVENRNQAPPTVMVPVGVLKRKGSSKSRTAKSVMFCDGIRPGSDLTELDQDVSYVETRSLTQVKKPSSVQPHVKVNKNVPKLDGKTLSFIPSDVNSLPPTVTIFKSDISYTDCANTNNVVEMLKNEPLIFSLQRNLYVHVKIINMDCCVNKLAWCFSTEGMITVGQDEIVILLEVIDNESAVPKDVFIHLNNIYNDAVKGSSISEYGISIHNSSNFLESKNHAGFLYIRPSFQCLGNVIIPKEPYLIGILIHRWETPWAKIFPLRLVLRLGAEYRYYPSPIISTRHRESVYVEIGHTIINLLADFRNFTYTLPNIRGLSIHMEEKNTTVTIPMNRYDQVLKSLNNSTDHILSFAGNFSSKADSHLVCIQDTHGNNENAYTTHAINIQNKPRKVTGASFIVFNGALKSSSGLMAKSSIIEDGLMIQILPERMVQIRESLRNMKNHTIQCGCANAKSDETVTIVWGENDTAFNIGVKSPIDNQAFDGVPSIRVHNGKDFICNNGSKMFRWTEVFILQNGEDGACSQEPVDISKLSESISKASSQALVKYLDLLATNNFNKVGVRTTLHVENVSYMAGSNGVKLPPIYMKSLDNELIPVLHRITSNNLGENAIVLELIFHVLNI